MKGIKFVLVLGLLVTLMLSSIACTPTATSDGEGAQTGGEVSEQAGKTDFPSGTVTIVVPWPAGGRSDITARLLAAALEPELGVPVIVANTSGGGGVVGARSVGQAKADGYTMGLFASGINVAQWTKQPPFEFEKYEPICRLFINPLTITVRADSPWQTLDDFLNYAKENPGKVKHGNGGAGTADHILAEGFYKDIGVKVTQVPYEGDSPRITALLGGEIDVNTAGIGSLKSQLEAGEIRVLAVSSEERSPFLPDVPTFKELGYDFTGVVFDGMYVAKGTPEAVIKILEEAIEKACTDPEMEENLNNLSVDIQYMPSKDFKDYLDYWHPILEELVDELGLRMS